MKYLITEKNIKWDVNYTNVNHLSNEEDRDAFVNSELFTSGDYMTKLKAQPNVNSMNDLGNAYGSIEIEFKGDFDELRSKNHVVLYTSVKDSKPTFWWIESISNTGNNNMYTLDLRCNIFLTYPGVQDKMKNFYLTEGHVDYTTLIDLEFDGGISMIEELETLDPVSPKANSQQWMVVYRKLQYSKSAKSMEEGAKLKISNYDIDGGRKVNTLTLPFKVFIAPVIEREIDGNTFNSDAMMEYYNETENDGLTYGIKMINYEFHTSRNTMVWVDHGFMELKTMDMSHLNIHGYDGDDENTYELEIPDEVGSVLELVAGVNEYALTIEGVMDFAIPLQYLYKEDGKFKIKFTHTIGLAPSGSKEAIFFQNENGYTVLEDQYSWTNETDFAIYVNQLNEYKASNPMAWTDWGGGLKSIISGAATGAIGGSIIPGAGTAVGAGIGAVAGAVKGIGGLVSTGLNRAKLKRKPENIKGDGDTYFFIANTKSPYAFSIKKNKFISARRDATITSLYTNGIALDSALFIKDLDSIKRPRFNFVQIGNFLEANRDYNLPTEILEAYAEVFERGVRLWHDNYLTYDDAWLDNGDALEDIV